MLKRVMSQFFVEFFLAHSAEKFGRGTLYCVLKFGYREILCFRGLCHEFPSKRFCLTVPKNAVGESFSLSIISHIEKVWMRGWWGGGECQDFPSKSSCLTVPKKIIGQPFNVSLISGMEIFYASEGYVTIFQRVFCLTVPKIFVGEPIRMSLLSGNENIYAEEGYVTVFCRFFCLAVPKILQWNPSVLCFRKILIGDKFMDKKGGGSVKMFRRKFCLTVPKFFVGEPFRLSMISGIEKFYA